MIFNNQTYLRPFSFLGENEGIVLSKTDKAIRLANGKRFFTKVEVITRKKKISKKIYTVENFLKIVEKKKNKVLLDSLNELVKPRNLFKKKKLFKKKDFYIFGILNITPDSFSDGGDNLVLSKAIKTAESMSRNGSDFIDIGGESTRPGAEKVKVRDEIIRVLPMIQYLEKNRIKISLDTRNSSTMKLGLLSGVSIINDVSALTNDSNSVRVIQEFKPPIILMHMPGTPKNMMNNTNYNNVVLDIFDYLNERIQFCESRGIKKENIIIDPGIGFGKTSEQNLEVLKNISIFHSLGCPIMLGVSRKRFITDLYNDLAPKDRLPGSIATALNSFNQGIQIMRVHDVPETQQALEIFNKLETRP